MGYVSLPFTSVGLFVHLLTGLSVLLYNYGNSPLFPVWNSPLYSVNKMYMCTRVPVSHTAL